MPFVPLPSSRPALTTVAAASAARTDRRPVAGGVHDPRAGKTFISWGGFQEDNYVQEYDHLLAVWSAPVRVAGGDNDSHNYPTLIQADDGHLLVFRGLHNRELWVARSPAPHSIAGTWTDTIIPAGLGATYPMPVKTSTGDIFVFIRETAGDFDPAFPTDTRPMKYVRSTDDGLSWQSSTALTGDRWCIAPLNRADNMNEIYLGQIRVEGDRIAMVWTLAGGGPEGHLHDRYHRNVYYATFSPDDLRFRSAAGRDLGTSVDDADQERYLKVAATELQPVNPRSPDYISLVGSTLGGRAPFVVWMQLDAQARVHTHSAVHLPGVGWRATELGTGARVRDMEPADDFSWRVHATPDPAATGVDTYRLVPGLPWRRESTLATPQPIQRIEVIAGHRRPARLLLTGASSAREVTVADGDVYVAG
ncbi:BNR-4 repeat-containing protein [Actinoplanes awajinensis]|uniref:BNR-4 repeat-containing protein n=1 Tax=Actinoplanes awajinensis TaxID=135946 RepID=UPI001E31E61A|nr:BNR-4 repeat-containing protein [Actinoplanes awajinensis]